MAYGLLAAPDVIDLAMTGASPAQHLRFKALSYDIAPQTGGGNVAADTSHASNVTVIVAVSDPIPATAPAATVDLYNGYYGVNPRGFWVNVTITPTGAPAGYVLVTVSVPGFDDAVCQINLVAGGTGADFLLDTFHDVNGTQIAVHVPDYAPDGGPVGELTGWRGRAAYSDTVQGNKLVSGGNDGTVRYGRRWVARHDLFVVSAVMTPKASPGEVMAVIGRASKLDGNTDTGFDLIWFFTQRKDANTVYVSWDRRHSDGGGWHVDEGEYQFGTFAWAVGAQKMMSLAFVGSTIYCIIANADGTGATVVRSPTLATSWSDSSHEYAGYADTCFSDSVEIAQLSAMALAPVGAQNPGGAWEALGAIMPTADAPWESMAALLESQGAPWESSAPMLMQADVPWESVFGNLLAQGIVNAEAVLPWVLEPAPPPTAWAVQTSGGSWAPDTAAAGTWQEEV